MNIQPISLMRLLLDQLLFALLLLTSVSGAASVSKQAVPLRVAILSDFNGSYGSTNYPPELASSIRRIVSWQPELVLSAGDMVAGQKASLSRQQLRQMWASFDHNVYQPLQQAKIPFAFALGNHDASLRTDRQEALRYWQRKQPQLNYIDDSNFPFFYSFAMGGVFFAAIDASGPKVSQQQRTWLQQQLASSTAQQASFRVVVGHLPLAGVSAGKNKVGEIISGASQLRQLLEKHNASLYIHGHHAAYYPARLGQLNVLSSGGIGGRDYIGYPQTARSVISLLEFGPSGLAVKSYDASTGQQVPLTSLPAKLEGLGGPLLRSNWR